MNIKRYSTIDKYITAVIVIAPMFTQYSVIFSFILLPELFLLPFVPYYLVKNQRYSLSPFKYILLYLLVIFVLSVFSLFFQPYFNYLIATTTFTRFAFYSFLIVFFSYRNFDVELASKLIVFVAALNAIYGITQFLSYNFYGVVLPWYFSFLRVEHGTGIISQYDSYFNTFGFRFSGMFPEPAHFSQYISFAILVLLYYKPEKQKIRISLRFLLLAILILATLISGSATGFATVVISFGFLFFKKNEVGKAFFSLNRLFFPVVLMIMFTMLVLTVPSLQSGAQRLFSIEQTSTLYVRFIRPFIVYSELPLQYKIFGVGYGNYSDFVFKSGLSSAFEYSTRIAWTNYMGFVLVGSGIIGFVLYTMIFINFYKNTYGFYRYLLVLFFVLAFFTDVPISFLYVLAFSFIVNIKEIKYNYKFYAKGNSI